MSASPTVPCRTIDVVFVSVMNTLLLLPPPATNSPIWFATAATMPADGAVRIALSRFCLAVVTVLFALSTELCAV